MPGDNDFFKKTDDSIYKGNGPIFEEFQEKFKDAEKLSVLSINSKNSDDVVNDVLNFAKKHKDIFKEGDNLFFVKLNNVYTIVGICVDYEEDTDFSNESGWYNYGGGNINLIGSQDNDLKKYLTKEYNFITPDKI